ncbi:MAG: PKD domain-containing protein [Salinivirgaceae bacterium]
MKKSILILMGCLMLACNDGHKDVEPAVRAGFTYEVDAYNFYKVQFTNLSENALHYSWDFDTGDTSNLENPVYTFTEQGIYEVSLTAYGNDAKIDSISQDIILAGPPTDPQGWLYGKESKTWKLYRVGSAVTLGPNPSQPDLWWKGFSNDGSHSCLYTHKFTFFKDGTYAFDANEIFWGYNSIWLPEDTLYETCFVPTAENMVVNQVDLSPWLSGNHTFEFNSAKNEMILRGKGAWIGFPFLGTSSDHGTNLPDSVAFSVRIENFPLFDLMTVNFDHGDAYWTFRYVSYSDWQDEPDLVE